MSRDHHIEQLEERLNRLRIREVQAVESLQRLRTEEEKVAAALVVAQLRATRTPIHSPVRASRTDTVTTPTARVTYHVGERVEILNPVGALRYDTIGIITKVTKTGAAITTDGGIATRRVFHNIRHYYPL